MFVKSIDPEQLEQMELAVFPGKIVVIDSLGPAFDKAIRYLRSQKVIGFDTETRPCFSPSQPHYGVALLQLSGPEKAYLFRINKIGMQKRLANILASDQILKIGAAVKDDIRGLQKYMPFEEAGFVDLQKIVWEWGIKDKSVKKMSAIILGFRVSKTQQLSNWEAEQLSDAQQKYAATDAWVCREMYFQLQKSEKHPLTAEEMLPPMPPEQKAKMLAKAEARRAHAEMVEASRKRKAARREAARKRELEAQARKRQRKAARQAAHAARQTEAKKAK